MVNILRNHWIQWFVIFSNRILGTFKFKSFHHQFTQFSDFITILRCHIIFLIRIISQIIQFIRWDTVFIRIIIINQFPVTFLRGEVVSPVFVREMYQ